MATLVKEKVSNWMPNGYYYAMAKRGADNGNEKVQPRLSPELHQYLDDLVATGFYGKNKTQVAQRLIETGIMKAIADRHIDIRKKPRD